MEDLRISAVIVMFLSLSCMAPQGQKGGGGAAQPGILPTPNSGQSQEPQLPDSKIEGDTASGFPQKSPVPSVAPTGAPPSSEIPKIVEFHIPAGAGAGPWNTKASPLEIRLPADVVKNPVTLRIINDDSTAHVLHTNGAPCPHQNIGAPTRTGGVHECVIKAPFDSTAGGVLYDHNKGQGAWFYVRAKK